VIENIQNKGEIYINLMMRKIRDAIKFCCYRYTDSFDNIYYCIMKTNFLIRNYNRCSVLVKTAL